MKALEDQGFKRIMAEYKGYDADGKECLILITENHGIVSTKQYTTSRMIHPDLMEHLKKEKITAV